MKGWHILGVDGGGTKTECALAHPDGAVVARAIGGPSNHEAVGYEKAGETVAALVTRVLGAAECASESVAGACFAMAGMDLPPDREAIRDRIVAPLGLRCPVHICNDAYAGFRAGSPRGRGVCVSLGTSITFCGCDGRGESVQFEYPRPEPIDDRVRRALMAEYNGVGPSCAFGADYLAALGVHDLETFYWSAYAGSREYARGVALGTIRNARPILFRAEHHGDPILRGILDRYAAEIAEILEGLARRLRLHEETFDLVLSGSLLTKGRHPALNGGIVDRLGAKFPGCEPVLVDGAPVEGALRIAAELMGAGARDT